ncbi:MAG: tetratricopeptide repeat protein [Bacteroidales bacterium]|nr:tetratricopeptide repeat protein [Bacteroidales bacterium]
MHSRTGLFFCIFCIILAGCSTKRNTVFTRNYHNLTSFYNVYWNGREALKEMDAKLHEKAKENYFEILPVFPGSIDDTAISSELSSRVIEKGTLAVKKHSIQDKGKEVVKYIDDAYVLMGIGFFYKYQFSDARKVFNSIISNFGGTPEANEALLWTARTYIEEEEFSAAQVLLSRISSADVKLKKDAMRLLPLVWADYYIKSGEEQRAVPYLKEGIKLYKVRDEKVRLLFILGQIAQKQGNQMEAYKYYKKCVGMNPPLAMSFNARLNMALCYDGRKNDIKSTVKQLQRMLLDTKNSAYFGRIYYVLGEIAFQNKDEEKAVTYMDKSIDASGNDNDRKLLAARRLSTYFYEKRDFISAQKYYAIAASVVDPLEEDAYQIKSRAEALAELVRYYNAFIIADTIKIVGNMSKDEQTKYAAKKAKEYKEQKERERAKALEDAANAVPAASNSTAWYFYNTQSKNVGYNEFVKKWGKRELEDFWFLSNKPRIASFSRDDEETSENQTQQEGRKKNKDLTPADPDYYLKDIPKFQSDFERIDSAIEVNLFGVGRVYYDRMSEGTEGEKYLVRLIKDYPESNFVPAACELLCKIYHERGDNTNYEKYAGLLRTKYPNTEQNGRINDPDYYKKLKESEAVVSKLYETLYEDFSTGRHSAVLNKVKNIEEKYPVNSFKAQILYMKGISTGHIKGRTAMTPFLQQFLNEFATHELASRVSAMLSSNIEIKPLNDDIPVIAENVTAGYSNDSGDNIIGREQVLQFKQLFAAPELNEKYYVVLLYNRQGVRANVLKIRINDFNRKMFLSDNLSVEIKDFESDRMIVEISTFETENDAEEYRKTFSTNDYIFGALDVQKNAPQTYVVSKSNYDKLLETKDEKGYRDFLQK